MLNKHNDLGKIFILFLVGIGCGVSVSYIYLILFLIFGYFYFIKELLSIKHKKTAFVNGLVFGFGYFLGCMHWIVYPFLVYEKHLILAPFVLIFFPLFLGLFFGFSGLVINFSTKIIKKEFFLLNVTVITTILFFFELARAFIFGGLPLSLTAHIWALNSNFISIASYIGVFGLCFLTILWITIVSLLCIKKKFKLSSLTSVLFPCFLFFFPLSDNIHDQKKINVRVIQPNINQKDKWNKDLYQQHFNILVELTKKDLTASPTIIVWPEVSLTLFLNEEDELINYLDEILPKNVFLVTGSLRREFKDESFKIYNSFFTVKDKKLDYYDKVKLVPFGEFIPFKGFLNLLKITPGSTDFSVGNRDNILNLVKYNEFFSFQPSICYESIFQSFHYKKISLYINVTNDAWFGNTTGPKQHLAASIFRAVEKGVPLVRSANSGISVISDKSGKIIERKGLNERGFIETEVLLGDNSTFFMKHGNKVVIILVISFLILSLTFDIFLKIRKKD